MNTKMRNRRANKKVTLPLDESGAVAVVVAITFIVLCGFVSLALDLGHIVMVKGELQRTADAAALAGAMGFLPYTNPGPPIGESIPSPPGQSPSMRPAPCHTSV